MKKIEQFGQDSLLSLRSKLQNSPLVFGQVLTMVCRLTIITITMAAIVAIAASIPAPTPEAQWPDENTDSNNLYDSYDYVSYLTKNFHFNLKNSSYLDPSSRSRCRQRRRSAQWAHNSSCGGKTPSQLLLYATWHFSERLCHSPRGGVVEILARKRPVICSE